jgi:hypothetical protein
MIVGVPEVVGLVASGVIAGLMAIFIAKLWQENAKEKREKEFYEFHKTAWHYADRDTIGQIWARLDKP